MRSPRATLSDVLAAGAFLLAIWVPLFATMVNADIPQEENRQLAPPPPAPTRFGLLTQFGSDFAAYFDDNFGFRRLLISWQSLAKYRYLGVSNSPNVVVGKNGWLFYGDPNAIANYRRNRPFTREELEQCRRQLIHRSEWLAARRIRYLIVIAPDKPTVYPEFMPDRITRTGNLSRLDRFLDRMQGSGVDVLDVRPSLLEAKKRLRVYPQTDTHWNDEGACLAYRSIAQRLSPAASLTFERRTITVPGLDLAKMLGISSHIKEAFVTVKVRDARALIVGDVNSLDPVRSSIAGSTLPRMALFGDSFSKNLVPFLAEAFSEAVYTREYVNTVALMESVRAEVVIQEIGERRLMEESVMETTDFTRPDSALH